MCVFTTLEMSPLPESKVAHAWHADVPEDTFKPYLELIKALTTSTVLKLSPQGTELALRQDEWNQMYGLPCILTLVLRQKHCKHYQNKHSEQLACLVLSVLQASLYLQGSGEVRETLCFLPSASLLALDLIIPVSHCQYVQAQRLKKPLNINLFREVNF